MPVNFNISPDEGPAEYPDFSRAYVLPDSAGGYVAGSSDGYEMLTPASTPADALEDLGIAKLFDSRLNSNVDDDVDLEDVITDLGFDPDDFLFE